MAAPRIRCNHCGEPFDRRAVTVFYCKADACQKAHARDRMKRWRKVQDDLTAYVTSRLNQEGPLSRTSQRHPWQETKGRIT